MTSGALDLVDADPPGAMLRAYQADPSRGTIRTTEGQSTVFATFNVAQPPFDDVAVRRAVAYALDRGSMVRPIQDGYGSTAIGGSAVVADHFAPDPLEASLLSVWSGFPGAEGAPDLAAARAAIASSPYSRGGRCAEPVCEHVSVMSTAVWGRSFRSSRPRSARWG